MSVSVDLFAGLYVRDLQDAKQWYSSHLGGASYLVGDTEAVWTLAEHRCLFIEQNAQRAGLGVVTIFFADFDARLGLLSAQGLHPDNQVTYGNGVRKANFLDPDGNEIGFGGAPVA